MAAAMEVVQQEFAGRRTKIFRVKPKLALLKTAVALDLDPNEWDRNSSTIETAGKSALDSLAAKVRGDIARLGLPNQSAEQRANQGGVMSAPSDLSDGDLLTDRAYAAMGFKHRSHHYRVITLWWFQALTMPQMEKTLGCKRSSVYRQIDKAAGALWRIRQSL